MTFFFISDPHFGAAKPIRIFNRPFANVEELNATLLTNWNSVVGPQDTVLVNGDFQEETADQGFFHRLNGEKILVIGNHDLEPTLSLPWSHKTQIFETNVEDKKLVFCHYPMEVWNQSHRGSIHLFGHVHINDEDLRVIPRRFNICPERVGYTPIPLVNVLSWGDKKA